MTQRQLTMEELEDRGRCESLIRHAFRGIEGAPKNGTAILAYGVHVGSPRDAQRGVEAGDRWWGMVLWDVWRGGGWVFAKDGAPAWSEPTHFFRLYPPAPTP